MQETTAIMSEILDQDGPREAPDTTDQRRGRVLAAGGFIGALLASSCCVVPLLLVGLGVSGAWIGNLTALAPYKWYFLLAAGLLLAAAFWHTYFKAQQVCAEHTACSGPATSRITRMVVWLATLLVLLSATVNLWAPWFY